MSEKVQWMEVWARAKDEPDDALIYKFPLTQWQEYMRDKIRAELEEKGCTGVRFVEVVEQC